MPDNKKRTILLVEDQAIIALGEKKALEKYGYNVIMAMTGEKAIEEVEKSSGIDLVLMDINLGDGIDGTLASLRILEKVNVPIVFLSSHSEPDIVEKTEKITSYGYILKNSSITVLDASIKMAFKLFDAHEALKEREASLAHAEMIANIGNWRLDLGTRTLEASDGARKIYGLMSDVTTWDEAKRIPLPEYRDMLDKGNRELVANGKQLNVEFRIRRACDGKMRWVHNISDYDRKKNVVIGVIEDITERKMHEQELTRQENLLSSIIESSSESIFAKDLDGKYQLINNIGSKVIGHSPSEILGHTDFDFLPEETAQRFRKDDDSVIQSKLKIERETIFLIDGEEKTFLAHKSPWLDKTGKTIGVIGISNDVSKLKELENETSQFRNRLVSAMTAAKLVWWELDTHSWKIVFDRRIMGIFGYAPDRFQTAADFFSLVHPDEQQTIQRVLPLLSAGHIFKYGTECRIMAAAGEYRWYYIMACAIKDDVAPAPFNLTGILMDIDEQKRADGIISKLLDEKEMILKEVHHRIKNSMNTIQSLLSLQASNLEDSMAIAALEDASDRVGSMMILYEKLYQSSSYLSSSLAEYIPVLIEQIARTHSGRARIETETHIEDIDLAVAKIQPLGIIINEAVTNAMKYAFNDRETGKISVSASTQDALIHVEVSDNGIGLPAGVDFKHSSGFGLSLLEMLAQQLNGNIWVEPGKGTKIVLEFKK